jgi:hypothetical protein
MKFFDCIKMILLPLAIGMLVTPPVFADNLQTLKSTENKALLATTHAEMMAPLAERTSRYRLTEINSSRFVELSQTEQKNVAFVWGLSANEYAHYLQLMENSPNGLHYRDQHLDPSWILGMNAKTEEERRKYVTLAVLHERERMAKLLVFQQAFDRVQRELFPDNKPIQFLNQEIGVPVTCR